LQKEAKQAGQAAPSAPGLRSKAGRCGRGLRSVSLSLFLLPAGLVAQDLVPASLPAESVLLGRIRAHMGEVLRHAPNYTCVETMERTRRIGPAHQFQMQDILRLEVALVDGKEMFAWPGSKKFESDDLRTLISGGAYGNGTFALFARAVFLTSAPTFVYRGDDPINGRPLVRYDFRVQKLVSGYQIRVAEVSAIVGYHGSFWVDRQSLDAARLQIFADDIPAELGLSFSSDRIDYSRQRIGEEDFLLPKESELEMRQPSGTQNRNFVRFSSCRQYTGESVLRFDDLSDAPDARQKAPDEEIVLPEDMVLRIALMDDINLTSAAAGDPVNATLEGDLRQKGRLLAAKGGVVTGRITRMERYQNQTVVGIVFTDLYANGKHAALSLRLERVLMGFLWTPPRTSIFLDQRPHEGLIQVQPGRAILRRGILMYWRT